MFDDHRATVHIETAVKSIIMGEISKCVTCGLGFPSLEGLKSEVRLQQHEKTPHKLHHPELVDPNTGTVSYIADSIAEVQETMTNSLDFN